MSRSVVYVSFRCAMIAGAVFGGMPGRAQVTNNDCLHALPLFPANGSGQCMDPGAAGFALPLMDSTDLAMVDLPYPLSPLACIGYPGYTIAPAADLWYKAYGQYGYAWNLESADSLQLAVWVGGGCANLLPISCFAVANGTITGQLCGLLPSTDTLYLQVSNKSGTASDARYRLCFTSACPADAWANFQFDAPTPVQCVMYNVGIQPCTWELSSDGELHVVVTGGNPPFTITWEDGSTELGRTGLTAGSYPFTLIDGQGCATMDTAVIECSTPTWVEDMDVQSPPSFVVVQAEGGTGRFYLSNPEEKGGDIVLTNSLGQFAAKGDLRGSWLTFPALPESPGMYAITVSTPGSPRLLGYLIIQY